MNSPLFFKMNNIPTEKLGKSEWLTRTDIRKLEKMYKCEPKHERIKNLGKYLLTIHIMALLVVFKAGKQN